MSVFSIVILKRMRLVINKGLASYVDDESYFVLGQNDCEMTLTRLRTFNFDIFLDVFFFFIPDYLCCM